MRFSKAGVLILRILAFLAGIAIVTVDFLLDRITHSSETGFGTIQYLILVFGVLVCLAAFYQRSWFGSIRGLLKWAVSLIVKFVGLLKSVQERWFLFETLALIALAWVYFYIPFTRSYPAGYAGLYQLEIEQIIRNHFSLPMVIPYYGPGGIPAAYPFLALYIGAFLQHFFHISALSYLRFAPAAWTLCAFVTVYFFFKEATRDRAKAVTAVLLMALTYEVFEKHATAAGIVRGPALLFTMLTLIGLWKITHQKSTSFWLVAGTGLAAALTTMSHLSYLTFLVITCLALFLFVREVNWKSRLLRLAGVGLFCAVFASPWWGTVLLRYGFSTFLNAFNSHGTMELAGKLVSGDLKDILLSLFAGWGEVPMIGLTLLGLVYALVKRHAFTFWWFLFVFLLLGDNARFLILIGALLAADLILDVLKAESDQNPKDANGQKYVAAVGLLLLLGFLWARFLYAVRQYPQALDADLAQAAGWLKENSAPNDQYLFFASNHDTAEWVPWLSERVPAVGHWGSEWMGDYTLRYSQWKELSDCVDRNSLDCLNAFTKMANLSYDFILVKNTGDETMDPFSKAGYKSIYNNESYSLYLAR